MRMLAAAVGVACAAGMATAQLKPPANGTGAGTPVMPGQAVGTGFSLPTVGTPVSKAANTTPVGSPVGNALTRPYDPTRPLDALKGTGLDPNSVVAPVVPMGMKEPNLLDRLYEKLGTVTGFRKPDTPPRTNFVPGISRRNRERAEQRMWRRD